MPSPFIRVNADGQIMGDYDGKFSPELVAYLNDLHSPAATSNEIADEPAPVAGSVPVGGSVSGVIDFNGDIDQYTVNLVAGQTYLFSLRGTGANPINDSLLQIINPSFTAFVAQDDDGGNNLYSIITYTATETGTYTIRAQTFTNPDPDVGGYTIDVRAMGADSVGSTNATAAVLNMGTVFGFVETSGDVDRYAVTLTAGQYYTFNVAGGADYNTNPNAVPAGELDTILTLRSATGTVLASNDDNSFPTDLSSGLGFYAETSGTYYIDAQAYPGQTGGYALEFNSIDLSTRDPLDSIDWVNAANIPFVDVDGVPTAYVYFAPAGMHFGETADDGVTHMTTFGWQPHEIAAVMLALEQYEQILGVNYEITHSVNQATFRLMTTSSDNYGAYFYPHDPAYGDAQGIGVFNVDSGGWGAFPQSLEQGGYAFAVILHEFGHAHGLAHPHDTGGGSEVMLGVSGSDSRGIFDLNQGVYTVMSYNDAWETHPDGASAFFIETIDNGWSGTLSAFDIAQLQERYGVQKPHNTGDNVYALTDNIDDAFYQTIWDTGGNDTISYSGSLNAQIDLTAATLDYTPTGGGVVSFLHNPFGTAAHLEVKGGYTIAHGVVIENATGGSGNDILIGNSANNILNGGAGSDTVVYRNATGAVTIDLGAQTATGGGGSDTLFDIENAVGSIYNDSLLGTAADNTFDGGDGDDIMVGGDGIDTASYASVSGGVTVNLSTTGAQNTGGGGVDTLSSFENLIGSRFNDTLTGTAEANVISGGAGNDIMNGGAGIDTVSYASSTGAVGVNLANTGAQNTSGAGIDTLSSFENLIGSNFNDVLAGTAGDNVIDGGHGIDRVSYAAAAAAVFVNLTLPAAQATGGAGTDTLISIENVTGSANSDTITGNAAANDIVGGAGNDTLDGGGGVDTASYAGAASAVTVSLAVSGAQDTLGAGVDTLVSFENLTGSNHNDTLTGTAAINTINGGLGNDTIHADAGNDIVNGGDGNDTVHAGDGNDTVNGDAGDDILNGGAGVDTVNGGAGNDTLNGDAGNDILNGGAGGDTVNGGTGNDRIIGDAGNDVVRGGDGLDVVSLGLGDDSFRAEVTASTMNLRSVGTMSVDIITDFDAAGNDWIDVSGLGLTFRGTSNNRNAGDLTYRTYVSIQSAESALGIDIDGQPGAAGIGGPVTVVYGNIDGRNPDFAIILLNTNGVDADDFAPPPPAAATMALTGSSSSIQSDYYDPLSANARGELPTWNGDYHLV